MVAHLEDLGQEGTCLFPHAAVYPVASCAVAPWTSLSAVDGFRLECSMRESARG